MNERQNTVVATTVASLCLVIVFLCPWRVESSQEIKWSPVYQPPLSYTRSFNTDHGGQGTSRIESEEAHIKFGLLALEALAVVVAGGVLYILSADSHNTDKSPASAS